MWKIAVGFVIFAAVALFMLSRGGDIDMSGEEHGTAASHAPAVAVPAAGPASASKSSSRLRSVPQGGHPTSRYQLGIELARPEMLRTELVRCA